MEFAELIADKSCHELYFDNFLSSYSLISKLRQMNLKATMTVREGHTGTAPLKGKKQAVMMRLEVMMKRLRMSKLMN